MKATRWLWVAALLWAAPSALAQQAPAVVESEPVEWVETVDADEANRQALRSFLARSEVERAAKFAGVDLGDAVASVDAMRGDRLANAAQQAMEIERRLVAADDIISLRATTLIIILLLLIIIIVAA